MRPMYFYLVATNAHGERVGFYTGKAGPGFVSPDPEQTFWFEELGNAHRQGMLLNRMTAVHGLRFVAPHPEFPGVST
jgi:hypothetical protein